MTGLQRDLGNGWYKAEVLIEENPHRDIEVLHIDAAGSVFITKVSSWVVRGVDKVLWREVDQLPILT